ncbi:hypothetical protein QUA13_31115, partial [Microcoleus sp. S28C3]|uniref:hypothetical protein n=1 Tax=Microcoleus sp. S28C3 TaxID=3055414 RepID=UPI002FD70F46
IGNGFITATAILILSVLYLPAICCKLIAILQHAVQRCNFHGTTALFGHNQSNLWGKSDSILCKYRVIAP